MSIRNSTLYRSLFVFSKSDQRKLLAVTAIQIILGILDLLGVALIGVLGALAVNGVQSKNPGTRVTSVLEATHLDSMTFQSQIAAIGLIAAVVLIGRTAFSIFFTRRILYFLSKKSADLSSSLISKLLNKNILYINERTNQENLFSVTSGVNYVTVGVIGSAITLISDLSLLAIMSIGLFIVDPIIAISTFSLFLMIGIVLYLLMHKRAEKLGQENSNLQIKSNELILESLETYRELSVRNRKSFYVSKISRGRVELSSNIAEMAFMPNVGKYVIETSVVIGALLISGIQFLTQDATHAVGTLAVFLAAGSRIAPAVLRMQQGSIAIKTSLSSALPTLTMIKDLEGEIEAQTTAELKNGDHFSGVIEISELHFSYPASSKEVISGIDLEIPHGTSVAIVGPSGAGKSTLADLVLGVLDKSSGYISISGHEPKEAIKIWPGRIGYVPQNIKIINGTIRDNVCLGFSNNEFTDEEVWRALEKAQLSELVQSLEGKLQSQVGEAGAKLSGGQRQRLGIARALLTNPTVLILDEATSALDGKTESEITNAIQALKGAVTVLTIAHRLSTVINSDVVVYLDRGKIQAKGTFIEVEHSVPEFAKQAELLRSTSKQEIKN